MFEETKIIAIVTILYAGTGISHACKGNWPWAIVWISYAMANVGMMWAMMPK